MIILKATVLSLALQCAPTVHHDTVLDVARTESSLNPFAIAEIIPKAEALQIVNAIEKKGRRYSVGLMQITSTNFRQYSTIAERLL